MSTVFVAMKIDHVSIAWSNLTFLQDAFESVGLKTDYGGVHSSGATHMSLLAFKDGSLHRIDLGSTAGQSLAILGQANRR